MSAEDDAKRARRAVRAKIFINAFTSRQIDFLEGAKQQVEHLSDMSQAALGDDYSLQKWCADATAFWINGAGLLQAAFLGTAAITGSGGSGGGTVSGAGGGTSKPGGG